MSTARAATPGKTRTCPHCRTQILASSIVCPSCRHHLRHGQRVERAASFSALSVAGTIRHPGAQPWEYAVVVSIRNERGEEVTRQVVGVGALHANEQRTFSVSVDVFTPGSDTTGG